VMMMMMTMMTVMSTQLLKLIDGATAGDESTQCSSNDYKKGLTAKVSAKEAVVGFANVYEVFSYNLLFQNASSESLSFP